MRTLAPLQPHLPALAAVLALAAPFAASASAAAATSTKPSTVAVAQVTAAMTAAPAGAAVSAALVSAVPTNAYRTVWAASGAAYVYASPNSRSPIVSSVARNTLARLYCYVADEYRTYGYAGHATYVWYKLADRAGYLWAGNLAVPSPRVSGVPFCGNEHRLPFPSRSRYYVTQLPGGSYSHYDQWNRHAIDLANGYAGGAVVAYTGGTVRQAGWTDRRMGNGIQVVIDYGANRCQQYAHLSSETVYPGQKVFRGTRIGNVGGSGYGKLSNFGPHLHFNIVRCSDMQSSMQVPDTAEAGNRYALTWVTSRNG